ncbi:MAG: circularly permuted type 2 ATP-grasp protein [Gammaproteobacteria bacterium]|nr:circularly permuted type 2 ATP-grasp protein [Gammaproteobacteria bacterium]MBT8109661.1 circularly permuted type 2 ATP-grasp protein [Gammaproteobacteria bacterium]NND46481.1 circularly permuted type 2 ATP-grasp protein [Woeseiaceae bacterium]NNL44365.1 circularly permuted type 2 ATP-grasp protein [Woeseiaceae bacterium]
MKFGSKSYSADGFHDELIAANGNARPHARLLAEYFSAMQPDELLERQRAVDSTIVDMGISFTIYSEGDNIDRAWPLDIIPRALPGSEWDRVEEGLKQRLIALNLFIDDLYNDRRILKDKIVPAELIDSSKNYLAPCRGAKPRHGVWAHICGSDLVRDGDGTIYVLEDNLRVPSGVSYMLENRNVIKRVFPSIFRNHRIRPVSEYPSALSSMLRSIAPSDIGGKPEIVVLTPGIYNSAYFEHSYLARTMGVELVEGSDLVVDDDDCVYMRTIDGLKRVDTIYRRIDDTFIDPEAFRPDSMLGVPGIMRAWRAGNVALANAPGSGVADDKVIYSYVPDIIRYYMGEDEIIPNVPTWRCSDSKHLDHVLNNIADLVVKPANESGGYGMLVGPHASKAEHEKFRELLKADPRNYIAQPTLSLSTAPTLCDDTLEPRHLDLRPFILQGAKISVTAGGLTRVAMVKGSLVVNSSQGGGSKDTWIVEDHD